MKATIPSQSGYKGNFFLVLFLLVLLGSIPVGFFFYGLRTARKASLSTFRLEKSAIWDQTTRAYGRLLFDSIPILSFYGGNLDSSYFTPIGRRYLREFSFLDSMQLYSIRVNNQTGTGGFEFQHLNFRIQSKYSLSRSEALRPVAYINPKTPRRDLSPSLWTECTEPILNFSTLIAGLDTTQNLSGNELFKYFYRISDRKISYLSVPQHQELRQYRDFMKKGSKTPVSGSNQNLVVFKLNPFKLPVTNTRLNLYQRILIRPLSFDSLSTNPEYFTTSIALPRAFSEYQLYFISTKNHVFAQATRSFLPQFALFIAVYLLIGLTGFLIFRNLSINNKLFKLQYDFINNFTHEFKTPVSVIKITGETLKSDRVPNPSELGVYGKILEEEADKLNNLMNRLLSFTQLENKVIQVHCEDLNLNDFFADLKTAYRLKYPDFQIDYVFENLQVVKTDKVLLNSIFTNLADNAYKYSLPDHKVLKVEVLKIKKWIVFRFIDQGIGIKKSEIDHIFNKFYKIENEFNVQGSIGIGLAFCKEVIDLLEGEIVVVSREGSGTEFRIKLPDLR